MKRTPLKRSNKPIKKRKQKRTTYLDIDPKTRAKVKKRDVYCVLCGAIANNIHHYVERSDNGLGIEENLVLLCGCCHAKLHGNYKEEYQTKIKMHLEKHYPEFKDELRKYDKRRILNNE